MRLTKKKGNEYVANADLSKKSQQIAWLRQVGFKLGLIEDIEEELFISIWWLFGAITNGIYVLKGKKIEHIDKPLLKKQWDVGVCKYEFHFNFKVASGGGIEYEGVNLIDYGKTWALTKGELK